MLHKKNIHLHGLDLLRFTSAIIVLFSHIIIFSDILDPLVRLNAYIVASMGVEIFFCLSGFLICRQGINILNKRKTLIFNTYCFISRRIMRTWPAYFFCLFCYCIFYKNFSVEILPYLAFVQNLYYPIIIESFFSVSWSITVEEIFFFLFPFLLVLFYFINNQFTGKLTNLNLILLVCIFIVFALFIVKSLVSFENWGSEIRRVAIFRLDAIAFGGIAYIFFYKYNKYRNFYYLNYLLFFFFSIISYFLLLEISKQEELVNNFLGVLALLSLSISGSTLVIIFCRLERFKSKIINQVFLNMANISYPIYLIHTLIIDLVLRINIEDFFLHLCLVFFISIIVSLTIRYIIEEPFIRKRPEY